MRASFIFVIIAALATSGDADPKARKSAPVTRADIDRLDKTVDELQKQIDKLVRANQQMAQALAAVDGKPEDARAPEPKPVKAEAPPPPEPKPVVEKIEAKPAVARLEPRPVMKKKPDGVGVIVGKISGAADAVVYVDDIVANAHGSATMKQEGKQFIPRVLVVQKGMTVDFPNQDAFFHNVFSVTPDHSFDLGSYAQGESKSVTMTRPGVVSVYCNMHPQMVGHILVVPSGNYVRAGKDGFFRLPNVPAGRHRVVAWAPNAKPVTADAEVSDAGVVTLELELKAGHAVPHTKKDGLPYGSYAD